jgi:hypothetical protein
MLGTNDRNNNNNNNNINSDDQTATFNKEEPAVEKGV